MKDTQRKQSFLTDEHIQCALRHFIGNTHKFKFKLNVLQLSKLGQSPLTSQHMSAERVHDRRHRCINEPKLSKRHTGGAKHHIRVTDEVYKLGKPIP